MAIESDPIKVLKQDQNSKEAHPGDQLLPRRPGDVKTTSRQQPSDSGPVDESPMVVLSIPGEEMIKFYV